MACQVGIALFLDSLLVHSNVIQAEVVARTKRIAPLVIGGKAPTDVRPNVYAILHGSLDLPDVFAEIGLPVPATGGGD